MVQGRKPDLRKRSHARRLREQGLSFGEIARSFDISSQGAYHLVRVSGPDVQFPNVVRRECQAVIIKNAGSRLRNGPGLCLACRKHMKRPSFADRLNAYRLSKGWTQGDLAEKIGSGLQQIASFELGRLEPMYGMLERLVRVLGQGLVGEPPL